MSDLTETTAMMQAIAKVVDEVFNGQGPKKVGFVLLIAPFDGPEGARTNFVSNSKREDVLVMLKEVVARFEGQPEIKGRA